VLRAVEPPADAAAEVVALTADLEVPAAALRTTINRTGRNARIVLSEWPS
jgi:hypothetical protein